MKKFDKEYASQYLDEVKFLKQHDVSYVYVKDIGGITTYKYTKTPELFKWLEVFYLYKQKEKD